MVRAERIPSLARGVEEMRARDDGLILLRRWLLFTIPPAFLFAFRSFIAGMIRKVTPMREMVSRGFSRSFAVVN